MPRVKWNEISLGNLVSVTTIILSVVTAIIAFTRQIDSVQAMVSQKNAEQDLRLSTLEDSAKKANADHDIIVEIRADVKAFRAEFARAQKP